MSCTVKFDETFVQSGGGVSNGPLRLLEASPALQKAVAQDKSGVLVVKAGKDDQPAVLCTQNRTFDLRLVETSNLVLLCAESAPKRPIAAVGDFYEASPVAPKLHQLSVLLSERLYEGPEADARERRRRVAEDPDTADQGLYTLADLTRRVQASARELTAALHRLGALQVGPHWRLLTPALFVRALEVVVATAAANGWTLQALSVRQLVAAVDEVFDASVLEHTLRHYAEPPADGDIISLDLDKIARFRGRQLLEARAEWPLSEFMAEWQAAVPSETKLQVRRQLAGLALIVTADGSSASTLPPSSSGLTGKKRGRVQEPTVARFFADDLSLSPQARFVQLFNRKATWSLADITPYLTVLEGPGQTVNDLLVRWAKSIQTAGQAGGRLYCKR